MSDLISRQDAIDAMWKALFAYEDLTEKQFMEHEELELKDWFLHRIFVQRMHEECMKAVEALPSAEPKTGEWVLDPNGMDWNIPAWRCSECGFVANYIGVEANGLGNSPMNWAGSKFCPQCGARITGYER